MPTAHIVDITTGSLVEIRALSHNNMTQALEGDKAGLAQVAPANAVDRINFVAVDSLLAARLLSYIVSIFVNFYTLKGPISRLLLCYPDECITLPTLCHYPYVFFFFF